MAKEILDQFTLSHKMNYKMTNIFKFYLHKNENIPLKNILVGAHLNNEYDITVFNVSPAKAKVIQHLQDEMLGATSQTKEQYDVKDVSAFLNKRIEEGKKVAVVYKENTLGYAYKSGDFLIMGVLGANRLDGGLSWKNGPVFIDSAIDSIRVAKKDDFEKFKVSINGYLEDEGFVISDNIVDSKVSTEKLYVLKLNDVTNEIADEQRVVEYAKNRLFANPEDINDFGFKLDDIGLEQAIYVIEFYGEKVFNAYFDEPLKAEIADSILSYMDSNELADLVYESNKEDIYRDLNIKTKEGYESIIGDSSLFSIKELEKANKCTINYISKHIDNLSLREKIEFTVNYHDEDYVDTLEPSQAICEVVVDDEILGMSDKERESAVKGLAGERDREVALN